MEIIDPRRSDRTYTVFRNVSHPKGSRFNYDVTVKTGLTWDAASQLRDKLQEEERQAHPERTSWTCDLYCIQMEKEQFKLW